MVGQTKPSKLPEGLHLNKSTGVISGTPKMSNVGERFGGIFEVTVVDKRIKSKGYPATHNSATQGFYIQVS